MIHEEDYLPDRRKERKQERKKASSTDRSKFKKTDQDKLRRREQQRKEQAREELSHLLRGRVTGIGLESIDVDADGVLYRCVLRGTLKREEKRFKRIVTIGDFVLFEPTSEGEGAIHLIEERFSTLARADHSQRAREQLIAANLDQVLITVSVVAPPLKPALVDRYIIAAQKGNMAPIIVVNKVDLLEGDPDAQELLSRFVAAYTPLGYPILQVSADEGIGLDALRAVMKDKASVFSGQSGVGKSSLINACTGQELAVGEIVEKTRKGAHTTSAAHLVRLEGGGWCVDTPGIKSFGLWNLSREEIGDYFPEIHAHSSDCRFIPCSHTHEPQCAVKAAVEAGEIPRIRYDSYLKLYEGHADSQA